MESTSWTGQTTMERALLQSQGGGALLPAQRPAGHLQSRRRLCARAGARSVRQTAVSVNHLDELRHLRQDEIVGGANNGPVLNGLTAAAEVVDGAAVERERLHAVADAAADRAEMHDIIGRQRDNWNHLLLHSTNSLALTASLMAALAPAAPTLLAIKASAGILLATTAATMAAVNKVQPSQLAEEQRNATRLWRKLERDVRAALEATVTTSADVEDAVDRVLALDAAYPLPLLPQMLDKFPETVEPARWWPRRQQLKNKKAAQSSRAVNGARRGNGWTPELEEEMRGIVRVIKAKDENEYLSTGKLALRLNRGLAVAGPALAGTAALAAAFIGSNGEDGATWAAGVAILCGALAAVANTLEHGGQVGMVFELCRNVAGAYRKIQEDVEAQLDEPDIQLRENGEVFETKVALMLGRTTVDLKQFREMASPSLKDADIKEFAGKLF